MQQEYALRILNLCKSVDQDLILDHVDFCLHTGELHLLWGENGAGKSTLVRTICGLHSFDSGIIEIFGRVFTRRVPAPGSDSQIAVLPQENGLIDELSVFQNLFLHQNLWFACVQSHFQKYIPEYLLSLAECLVPVLYQKVRSISPAQRQILLICKTILMDKPIFVFDEPLTFLTDYECKAFFSVLDHLRTEGRAIIIISHRVEQLVSLCDRVSIIRSGRILQTSEAGSVSPESLINQYVNAQQLSAFPSPAKTPRNVEFEFHHLSGGSLFNISFSIRAGEIVGFTGSAVSAKHELPLLLIGAIKRTSGLIKHCGKVIDISSPSQAIEQGIYYLPSNRDNVGIFMFQNIAFNIAGTSANNLFAKEGDSLARHYIKRLHINARSVGDAVQHLSGGNRKKVMMSRAFLSAAKLFLFEEPSAGIDACGQNDIYNIMTNLAQKGCCIILISSNFTELTAMCHKIYVLEDGRLGQPIPKEDICPEALYRQCMKNSQ